MRNKERFQKINWIVFGALLFVGLLLLSEGFDGTRKLVDSQSFDAGQSRLEFRWDSSQTALAAVLLFFSAILAIVWKRVFPFNVPLAMILSGFFYALFTMAYLTGWGGIIGFVGFVLFVSVGVIMILSYTVYFFR
ncbi:hypothetical protein FZC78_03070 [Rossellomorea vietnamensis]|uniref:RND transporter n=1 Tax=Rossellomorea vietnamensis TaxID=218284 RepID=A0A5D4NW04_9BACI|nr:hypothetical protein [Rossellomorea vietnamensis]TYS18535.1 hypothetical protein FZC78_03070 [Rossellomorea vietnamensis]